MKFIVCYLVRTVILYRNKNIKDETIMASLKVNRRLIMTPGPVAVDPRVSQAMSNSILGQFDPDFTKLMNETMEIGRAHV